MASSLPAWRAAVTSALERNGANPTSRFVQVATIRASDGAPARPLSERSSSARELPPLPARLEGVEDEERSSSSLISRQVRSESCRNALRARDSAGVAAIEMVSSRS